MEQDKCHICGSKSELRKRDIKLLSGKMVIKDSPYYKCVKCGKEYATSEQMQELSDIINIKRQEFFFNRPLINAGRSLALTIPADIVANYSLKKGKMVQIIPENKNTLTLKF
jgi:YgiT-type zinc finger domain-containing protein